MLSVRRERSNVHWIDRLTLGYRRRFLVPEADAVSLQAPRRTRQPRVADPHVLHPWAGSRRSTGHVLARIDFTAIPVRQRRQRVCVPETTTAAVGQHPRATPVTCLPGAPS